MASVPFILHASDYIPGKVIRFFSKHALATGIQFPSSAAYLKGKAVEVRMPLRMNCRQFQEGRSLARSYYNLSSDLETVLVFGGSQGALAINRLFSEAILGLKPALQVLHFTGEPTAAEQLREYYQQHRIPACVKSFEKNMHLAWQAADIVICRAGAVTMAEQLEFEVPGILIPYPSAADNHQELNADFFVHTIGGGMKRLERDLSPSLLSQAIETLLEKRSDMKQAMNHYKKKSHACSLVELIEQALREG
jgi:UDP-N-acetylglucosamine--N-acetylmuramyl-(pentapeptide) pyrophosphoryl-undecaprenol N-acetylglucosamine transferase